MESAAFERKASMRRRALRFSFGVTALVAVLFAGQAGHATASGNPKVTAALAMMAAHSAPSDQLHVIVEGSGATRAAGAHGAIRKSLGFVGGVAATVRTSELERLAAEPGVSLVAPDAPVTLTTAGAVSTSSLSTVYPARDAVMKPWNAGVTGQGVGIAVIDSGVAPSDAFGSRLVQVALGGQTGSLDDAVGHGTMVAGVAAGYSPDGKFIGIAPGASVYALNINRPTGVYTSDVITALKWVFDNAHVYNIRVVNLSLSENVTSSYKESPLDLAIERLWASGVFVAVAAGNRGAGAIDYAPANDPLAFAAGAFDTMDTSGGKDDTLLPWSSRGTTVDGFVKPEIVLPGRHIAGPLPTGTYLDANAPIANRVASGYAAINGTSFAAPQLAGAAAILFQEHPAWSPDNVKWLLIAKPGPKPKNSTVGSMNLGPVFDFNSTPGRANQGIAALVCAPGTTCVSGSTVASSWDSSSWSSSSWSSSSWSSSSWTSSSWSSTADWSSSSWSSSSWSSSSWSSTSWTTTVDGFDAWG
jgi:serine protease AprX